MKDETYNFLPMKLQRLKAIYKHPVHNMFLPGWVETDWLGLTNQEDTFDHRPPAIDGVRVGDTEATSLISIMGRPVLLITNGMMRFPCLKLPLPEGCGRLAHPLQW